MERGLLHLCQLCAISFSPIDLRLLAWYNNLGGQPPYNLPCLPLSKNSWSVYHKDHLLPRGSIQKKVPKTMLTRVYRHGIMIVQRARAPELIFVHRPRGHLWAKAYFAYVVNFVRCYFVRRPPETPWASARNAHVVDRHRYGRRMDLECGISVSIPKKKVSGLPLSNHSVRAA